MHVRLGAPVIGKDNVEIGKADRLVIDPKTLQIVQLVAKHGRIDSKEIIVDRAMADNVDAEGKVHLKLTSKEANGLREYYAFDYAPPGHQTEFDWMRAIGTPMGGPLTTITDATTRYTSLPDNVVVVRKGMDVQDRDFNKLGELEDIEFGPNAVVTGFTVRTGRLHHERRSFSVQRVAGVGRDYVRLNVTADEARAIAPNDSEG